MALENQPPAQPPPAQSGESNDRLWAALSYVFTPLVPIIVMVMEDVKNRPYPRYHAVQALGFFGTVMLFEVLASILFVCGSIVTLGLGACVLWLLFFLPIIPALYYGYLAYMGRPFDIPILTNFMIQQGWLRRI
jgi:uncharacterized membrane protein